MGTATGRLRPWHWLVFAAGIFLCAAALLLVPPSTFTSESFDVDPGHNPLSVIKNTPYEANYLDRFIGSRSEAETRAIMRRIDSDRRAFEERSPAIWLLVGLTSMLSIAAGILFMAERIYMKRREIGDTGLAAAAAVLNATHSAKQSASAVWQAIEDKAKEKKG